MAFSGYIDCIETASKEGGGKAKAFRPANRED